MFRPSALLVVLAGVLASWSSLVHASEPIRGMIGLGTWATQAEFKEITVTKDKQTLFASDFSKGMEGWKIIRGKWEVSDGALRQTSNQDDSRVLIGDPTWSDYTLSLKARKLGGNEGFLVSFGVTNPNVKSRWNIGGWGNTKHAIEAPGTSGEAIAGTIETGRWYDIRIELKGNSIRAFLNDQLIHEQTQTPAQRNFSHALIPDMIADPSIVEIDGTFYCNATTDDAGAGLASAGLPVTWKSKDFLNWSFSGSIFPDSFDAKYWAPSSLVRTNGRYYLFPTLNNKITAVVADSPEGPFRTPDGKDISRGSGWQPFPIKAGNPIDAEVFIDDDGAAYMVCSQRGIGKLKSDFSDFDGEQILIKTKRGGYSEGPFLFKRKGVYYYLYTLEGNENYRYAYMMSRTSPLGPWEAPEQDLIAVTNHEKGIYGPGHGCFFNPKGSEQWYFVYLEYGRAGTTRQVCADKMNFNADGTIQPIQLTIEGVGAIRPDVHGDETNLALGKHATASSVRPDFRVPVIADPRLNRVESYASDNALDGSNGSRWMAIQSDSAAWYQLDLGEIRDVKRTELYFVKPTAGHAYRLECSLDGNTWQPFGGHEKVIVQSPHTDVKSVRARYLRLTVLQGLPGLWEFRVY
jgi:hypothetical protein